MAHDQGLINALNEELTKRGSILGGAIIGGAPLAIKGGLGGLAIGTVAPIFQDSENRNWLGSMGKGLLYGAGIGGGLGALAGGYGAHVLETKIPNQLRNAIEDAIQTGTHPSAFVPRPSVYDAIDNAVNNPSHLAETIRGYR